MARKCKFDSEWEQALAILPENEAAAARAAIENYQQTGVMPAGLDTQVEMILLLVRPMIDRRRRASEAARRRRQFAKDASANPITDEQTFPQPIVQKSDLHPIAAPVTTNRENKLSNIVKKARRRKMSGKKFFYK